jgi:hypothetical protein
MFTGVFSLMIKDFRSGQDSVFDPDQIELGLGADAWYYSLNPSSRISVEIQ